MLKSTNKPKKILIVILSLVLVVIGFVLGFTLIKSVNKPKVSASKEISWEECIKTPGSTILYMFPGKCVTPDGRTAINEEDRKKMELENQKKIK